jgi:hypothetical protein
MDAEYLKEHVGETLALGLTNVVLNNPEDPVDHLARWLLKHVAATEAQAAADAEALATAAKDEAALEEMQAAVDAAADAEAARGAQKAARLDAVTDFVANATELEGFFAGLLEPLVSSVGIAAMQVGEFDGSALSFVATSAANRALEGKELVRMQEDEDPAGRGVTFAVFDEAQDEEEEEDFGEDDATDEDGNPLPRKPKEEKARSVYVPDVLMGPEAERVKFFGVPDAGSYLAVRVRYQGTLNDECLDAAVRESAAAREATDDASSNGSDTEESETDATEPSERKRGDKAEVTEEQKVEQDAAKAAKKKEALLAAIPLKQMDFALCADTLGQNTRINNDQIAYLSKIALDLQKRLTAIDRTLFDKELAHRRALLDFNAKHQDTRDEESRADDADDVASRLEKDDLPATTEDVAFKQRTTTLTSPAYRAFVVDEFSATRVFRGPVEVLQAFFYLLGFSKTQVCNDATGRASWVKMRALCTEEALERVKEHQPRAERKEAKQALDSTKSLNRLVRDFTVAEVRDSNVVLSEILGFVKDSLALREQAETERVEAAAEAKAKAEEARVAAEEEAASLAESEAADTDNKESTEDESTTNASSLGESTATEETDDTDTDGSYTETTDTDATE